MASSPPVNPPTPGETPDAAGSGEKGAASAGPGTKGAASAGPGTKWPRWRVLMLIAALILLATAILDTVDVPRWVVVVGFGAGYVLLAYGFFLAMSARREGSTPRDRG